MGLIPNGEVSWANRVVVVFHASKIDLQTHFVDLQTHFVDLRTHFVSLQTPLASLHVQEGVFRALLAHFGSPMSISQCKSHPSTCLAAN
jgi:hypothetical protein